MTPDLWKIIPGLSTRTKSAATTDRTKFPLVTSIKRTDKAYFGEHLHYEFLVPKGVEIESKLPRIKTQIRELGNISNKSKSVNIHKSSSPEDCKRYFHYTPKQTTEHYDPSHHHKTWPRNLRVQISTFMSQKMKQSSGISSISSTRRDIDPYLIESMT